uniref:Intraflagellar transport 20 n=1 Tax=Bos mutus grunniens TaxID=30521 RepID=A0A8B9XBR0_BOSMU
MTHLSLADPVREPLFSGEAGRQTAMAKDILAEAGLHFDELNKLRVLDPEVTQQTIELKEECKDFVDKIGQFQKIVGGLIELVDQLAKEAENEKMKVRSASILSNFWPGSLVSHPSGHPPPFFFLIWFLKITFGCAGSSLLLCGLSSRGEPGPFFAVVCGFSL